MVGQMEVSKKPHRNVLWIYANHALVYPWLVGAVIAAVIIAQVASLAIPLYLRQFFNIVASSVQSHESALQLVGLLTIIASLWVLDWLAERIRYFSTIYLEAHVMARLMQTAFDYLLGHSYNFFVSQFSGSLTHRVGKFSRAFETLFDSIFSQFMPTSLFIVGAVSILFMRNQVLGLALALWVLCFLAFQIYVSRLRSPARKARAAAETQVTANLSDTISNQATVMLFSGGKFEGARFAETVSKWQKATIRSWGADAWIWAGIGLFIIAIQAVLLYGGIYFWERGLFTVGDFVLVQLYLFATFERLASLNRDLRRVSDAYTDANEMVEILDTLHEVHDVPGAKPVVVTSGVVTFKNVDFHFHEENGIFNNFNLAIKAHEKVALVGPSGAGKSTLTKLILRLFDVKRGTIEIDGQNIANVTQESLRNAISFVPQEPILFHRTLMENIRYGKRDATDEEVIEAAKKAYCHEFISSLQHGYGTFVGERGVKLSGGERQRVAIARAILKDSPILMLDEATSSLDSGSELLIQSALANLMKGKTVLVIAHRLSTIMKMDRIIALADGAVAEEGTHQELLKKDGLYSELWRHQAAGFIQEDDDVVA